MSEEAARKSAEFVQRRTTMAEQKIAQAEAQALAEVKASAVDIAIAAAGRIIADKSSGKAADQLLKQGIDEVKSKLN